MISPKQKKSGNDWRSFSHSREDFITKFFAAEKRQRYRFSPNLQKSTSRRFVCQAGPRKFYVGPVCAPTADIVSADRTALIDHALGIAAK
jgi:hypothetical protein